jgi:transposase
MAARQTVTLDQPQSDALVAARDHDPRPYVRERCAAILKIAAGASPHAVARTGLLKSRDPDTVYAWLDAYRRQGLAGLAARQHGGYRRGRL